MPKRFCSAPMCSSMVPLGQRYCADHRYLEPVKKTKQFYLSPSWRRFREWYIGKYPLCAECDRHGRLVKAQMVDHIVKIEDGGLRLSEDNCQSLCHSCHKQKTVAAAKQRAGVK